MEKIYLVRYGEYSDQGVAGAFSTKEKAERYCEVHDKIDSWNSPFWVCELTVDENEIQKDVTVKKYYEACISLDNVGAEAGEIFSRDEDYEIYTDPVIIKKYDDHICVKSTDSLKHAEKIAIEQYQIHTQQKLEEEIMENK